MNITPLWLKEKLIQLNQEEYGVRYNFLNFIQDEDLIRKSVHRENLLKTLDQKISWGFKNSKADISHLSPGCRVCGEGSWSCLFINGVCNSRCFYCPAPQHDISEPETNSLIFPDPQVYVDYIREFGFNGISISGGEPLITFEKSLSFIREVKKAFGTAVHTWLYTNGMLFDHKKAGSLADAGLDELRFDIGALDYSLEKIKPAAGVIPIITVEIPAIPEDLPLMKKKISEMEKMGVTFLNLHQLRLTPYNYNNIVDRGYTFLHGEKITVLESELAALELMLYGKENNISLPVNYCSFVYKNRYQKSAARRRHASKIIKPFESITENGYIRRMKFAPASGSTSGLNVPRQELIDVSEEKESGEIFFHFDLLPYFSKLPGIITVQYFVSRIAPRPSPGNEYFAVLLNEEREIGIEKRPVESEILENEDELSLINEMIFGAGQAYSEKMERMLQYEKIPVGLQDYY